MIRRLGLTDEHDPVSHGARFVCARRVGIDTVQDGTEGDGPDGSYDELVSAYSLHQAHEKVRDPFEREQAQL